jgi:DGQHR domain-containing protein
MQLPLEEPKSISFQVVRIRQPIGDFFVGVMKARDLCAISRFDYRKLVDDRDGFERYLGIQRKISEKRVAEIEKYARTVDATFPTGVVIAVEERCATVDESSMTMTLSNDMDPSDGREPVHFGNIARVLDGQHRLKGLENVREIEFEMNVTVFVGLDIADQASVFSTVNLAQTKVRKSLAYDLYELAKNRSPQKTCHVIAVGLNMNEGGPLYHRIKRLGVVTEGRFGERITQATFVEALMPYLSKDMVRDRDEIARGIKLQYANADDLRTMIFRNMFIDEKDGEIGKIVQNFFEGVRRKWRMAWEAGGEGIMLARTNGFRALMRLLRPVYLKLATPGEVVEADRFYEVLEGIDLRDEEFTVERFKPGTSGESLLFQTLRKQV